MVAMTARPPVRPPVDASMRLLREIMEQPLDPAYAHAARRRQRAAAREGPTGATAVVRARPTTAVLIVLVAALCGWVVSRGVSELRRPEPGQDARRSLLEHEISRRTAAADAQQRTIQQLRSRIAAAQQSQLTSSGDAQLAARMQQLALTTGELPVRGPGLEISLQDARPAESQVGGFDPRASSSADDGRVLDRDLQIVVNGLWAAGAEAVAINGRRLTTLSAIRAAGAAILVDFRPLVPPYKVQAIGDASSLQTQFGSQYAGSYLQSLRDNYGVRVAFTAATDLRLPAAGAFQLRQAAVPTAVPTGPATSTSSGSTRPTGSTTPSEAQQ